VARSWREISPRREDEINEFVGVLRQCLRENPDTRFMALILSAVTEASPAEHELFFIEDAALVTALSRFLSYGREG
jgi:hypothetical protein